MTDIKDAPAVIAGAVAAPRFAGDRVRSAIVPLEWPIEFDGRVIDKITVRRMTAKEVSDFVETTRAEGKAELPMFDCPMAVIDALDADDSDAVNRAVLDFLPRSLRTADE